MKTTIKSLQLLIIGTLIIQNVSCTSNASFDRNNLMDTYWECTRVDTISNNISTRIYQIHFINDKQIEVLLYENWTAWTKAKVTKYQYEYMKVNDGYKFVSCTTCKVNEGVLITTIPAGNETYTIGNFIDNSGNNSGLKFISGGGDYDLDDKPIGDLVKINKEQYEKFQF